MRFLKGGEIWRDLVTDLKHAWNVFTSQESKRNFSPYAGDYGVELLVVRPDRTRLVFFE